MKTELEKQIAALKSVLGHPTHGWDETTTLQGMLKKLEEEGLRERDAYLLDGFAGVCGIVQGMNDETWEALLRYRGYER